MANDESVIFEHPERRAAEEELLAFWEGRIQALYEEASSVPREEFGEPLSWWNIYSAGPYYLRAQTIESATFLDQPLAPNRNIQVGQQAIIVVIVTLNPFFSAGGTSACELLASFGAKIGLSYRTCNVDACSVGPPDLNVDHTIELVLGRCFYLDFLSFTAGEASCLMETNVCARVLSSDDQPVPQFAAFATWVNDPYDHDSNIFFGSRIFDFERPIRFMISSV